jgi:AcrR family transcriptional regulator
VTSDTDRQLRADAARNAERILHAAREIYAEIGPDASLEEIARRAGVGIRTLYRRFPRKEDLVKAALEQSVAEQLSPAIEQALSDDDPRHGLVSLIEATMSLVSREHNTVAAARNSGALTAEIGVPLVDSLTELTRRAQQAGRIRADLTPDDTCRILGMLIGVLWIMDPRCDGWRRYVTLVMDGLSPVGASPLPPAEPLRRPDSWSV